MVTRRGTFESEHFAAQKEALGLDPKRFDDLLSAITWVLAHKPDEFPLVPRTRLRRIRTVEGVFGFPALVMYATLDDHDSCTLVAVEPDLDASVGGFTEADLEFLGPAD
jgi:hypothetical protein